MGRADCLAVVERVMETSAVAIANYACRWKSFVTRGARVAIFAEKAGTNADQMPTQVFTGPREYIDGQMKVGDVFTVSGQPDDVLWRVAKLEDMA